MDGAELRKSNVSKGSLVALDGAQKVIKKMAADKEFMQERIDLLEKKNSILAARLRVYESI